MGPKQRLRIRFGSVVEVVDSVLYTYGLNVSADSAIRRKNMILGFYDSRKDGYSLNH